MGYTQGNEFDLFINTCIVFNYVRVFVKSKKIQESAKNSELGGWVKPQLGFFFFWGGGNFVFFVLFSCFQILKNNWKLDRGLGGCGLTNPGFSRIFWFFFTWQDPLMFLSGGLSKNTLEILWVMNMRFRYCARSNIQFQRLRVHVCSFPLVWFFCIPREYQPRSVMH